MKRRLSLLFPMLVGLGATGCFAHQSLQPFQSAEEKIGDGLKNPEFNPPEAPLTVFIGADCKDLYGDNLRACYKKAADVCYARAEKLYLDFYRTWGNTGEIPVDQDVEALNGAECWSFYQTLIRPMQAKFGQ